MNVIYIYSLWNLGHSVCINNVMLRKSTIYTTPYRDSIYAKISFYRAANSIFGKVGRLASEEVIVQLLRQKCLPVLLYALEVCNLD